jgi:hypothetical protein
VSHDEAFVNRLLTGSSNGIRPENSTRQIDEIDGQLWVLTKKRLSRYEGTFRDYKMKIMKRLQEEDYSW